MFTALLPGASKEHACAVLPDRHVSRDTSVDAKSNEIPAVRDLLKAFASLASAAITIDAMHTHTDTAQVILGRQADRARSAADATTASDGMKDFAVSLGTWARRSSRYWLRAAGERGNFHRSARALPATRRHAGHISRCYETPGHSLTSRLCRFPGGRRPRQEVAASEKNTG
jgi:predicted transposase YbfD/YdcC